MAGFGVVQQVLAVVARGAAALALEVEQLVPAAALALGVVPQVQEAAQLELEVAQRVVVQVQPLQLELGHEVLVAVERVQALLVAQLVEQLLWERLVLAQLPQEQLALELQQQVLVQLPQEQLQAVQLLQVQQLAF